MSSTSWVIQAWLPLENIKKIYCLTLNNILIFIFLILITNYWEQKKLYRVLVYFQQIFDRVKRDETGYTLIFYGVNRSFSFFYFNKKCICWHQWRINVNDALIEFFKCWSSTNYIITFSISAVYHWSTEMIHFNYQWSKVDLKYRTWKSDTKILSFHFACQYFLILVLP